MGSHITLTLLNHCKTQGDTNSQMPVNCIYMEYITIIFLNAFIFKSKQQASELIRPA